MSISVSQSSFTGGEWAPSLHARTDLAKYATAAKKMRNFYPHPHGGTSNRPGLDYVCGTKTHSQKSRLVPFQFSITQGYIILFGDQYCRFIKDGGIITLTGTAITGITKANPGVVTSNAHGLTNGDRVLITGVLGMVEVNNREFTVAGATANTFQLSGVNTSSYTTYASGGTVAKIYEISTPYLEADLALLKFEQSADVLYITHPSYQQRKLTRSGHTAWTLSAITFQASVAAPTGLGMSGSGRFFAVTAVDSNGNESVPSATEEGAPSNTLSWGAVTGAVEYKVYEVLDGTYQYVARTATNSWAAPSTVTPDPDVSAPSAQTLFNSSNNYPGCSAFFDQRLLFARTNNKPQSFWGSVVGDFENMNTSSPLKDDDAFNFTINSSKVNEIRWMAELGDDMIIGTSGGEYKLSPGSQSDTVTPLSVKLRRQSSWGTSDIPPLIIGHSILFVEGSKQKVRDMFYALERDGYDGSDLTILAQHLFETHKIKEWAYQRHPDSIIWAVRDDGTLTALTYQKEHQVTGWHYHETDGDFESVASIETSDGAVDVYFIVKRTVNSATVRYVEKFHTRKFTDIENAFFVDSGLSYDGSVAATLTPGSGATVLGTTGVVFTAGSSVFVSGDVGREIHYRYETGDLDEIGNPEYLTAIALITGYTSGTEVTATIKAVFPSTDQIASNGWRLSVTTLSGYSHLAGKTVSILANGSVVSGVSVSSVGVITLAKPASKIHVGLGYTCDLGTLGFDYPTRTGTVQDKMRLIISVILRLQNTRSAWIGPDEDHLDEIAFRDEENYGQPTSLFNGDKEVFLSPPDDPRAGRAFIRVKEPLPITVQSVIARMRHGEK